jgi:hypothetical protein
MLYRLEYTSLEDCSEFGNFVTTIIYSLRNMQNIKYTKTIWYWCTNINESSLYATCIIQSLTDNWIINYKMVLPYACMHIFLTTNAYDFLWKWEYLKIYIECARYDCIDVMVFNATFNHISVISWVSVIGGGNRSIRRKPSTCHLGSVLRQNTTTDLTITLTIFLRLKYLGNATFTSGNHAQWILPM